MPDPRRKRNKSENNDGDQGDDDQGDGDQGEVDGDQGQDDMCPHIWKKQKDPRLTILLHSLHSGVQKKRMDSRSELL